MVRASIFTRGMLAGGMLLVSLGCKVREPGKLETSLAKTVKQRITIGGKGDQNPLPATAENIHAGRDNFSPYCFVCHGLDGQNTGVYPSRRKCRRLCPRLLRRRCRAIPMDNSNG